MVATKPLDQVVSKWQRKVQGATQDYHDGVNNPKADWQTETLKAEGRYREGVTRAASEGRFGKGVHKAGTEKWKRGATGKGVNRWTEGVSAATQDYGAGMGEVLTTLQSVDLPPRGPKGDPQNYARVQVIGTALHNKFKGK